jgi:hypothetical protein
VLSTNPNGPPDEPDVINIWYGPASTDCAVVITTAGEVVISVKEPTPNVAEVADGSGAHEAYCADDE